MHKNIMVRHSPLPKAEAGGSAGADIAADTYEAVEGCGECGGGWFDATTLDSMTTDLLNTSFGREKRNIVAEDSPLAPHSPMREGPFNLLGREQTREKAREMEKEARILAKIQEMKKLSYEPEEEETERRGGRGARRAGIHLSHRECLQCPWSPSAVPALPAFARNRTFRRGIRN